MTRAERHHYLPRFWKLEQTNGRMEIGQQSWDQRNGTTGRRFIQAAVKTCLESVQCGLWKRERAVCSTEILIMGRNQPLHMLHKGRRIERFDHSIVGAEHFRGSTRIVTVDRVGGKRQNFDRLGTRPEV